MRTLRRIQLPSVRMMFAIALVAMVVRAMVPVGWMVASDPVTGGFTLELCTGKMTLAGPAHTPAPEASQHAGHDDPHAHHMAMPDEAMSVAGHDMHADHGAPAGPDEHDHDYAEPACPVAMASFAGAADLPVILGEPPVYGAIDHELPPLRGPPAARVVAAPMPARGPPLFI